MQNRDTSCPRTRRSTLPHGDGKQQGKELKSLWSRIFLSKAITVCVDQRKTDCSSDPLHLLSNKAAETRVVNTTGTRRSVVTSAAEIIIKKRLDVSWTSSVILFFVPMEMIQIMKAKIDWKGFNKVPFMFLIQLWQRPPVAFDCNYSS